MRKQDIWNRLSKDADLRVPESDPPYLDGEEYRIVDRTDFLPHPAVKNTMWKAAVVAAAALVLVTGTGLFLLLPGPGPAADPASDASVLSNPGTAASSDEPSAISQSTTNPTDDPATTMESTAPTSGPVSPPEDPDPVGKTAVGNTFRDQMAAELDGWIYYANDADGCSLYKMRPDTSEKQKVNQDEVALMQASGDSLYYISGYDLIRLKDNGQKTVYEDICKKGSTYVQTCDFSSFTPVVAGNWIYYAKRESFFDGGMAMGYHCTLRRIHIETKEVQPLYSYDLDFNLSLHASAEEKALYEKALVDFCVVRDVVYFYSLYGSLYKLEYGREPVRIAECSALPYGRDTHLCSDGEWLYYMDRRDVDLGDVSGIRRIRLDGRERQMVVEWSGIEDTCPALRLEGDWIYYIVEKTTYRIRKDGQSQPVKMEASIRKSGIIGDWVYIPDIPDQPDYIPEGLRAVNRHLDRKNLTTGEVQSIY